MVRQFLLLFKLKLKELSNKSMLFRTGKDLDRLNLSQTQVEQYGQRLNKIKLSLGDYKLSISHKY